MALYQISSTHSAPLNKMAAKVKNRKILKRQAVLDWAYRGLTGGFLLLQNFSVAVSVTPHVCFIIVLILMSMFLR